MLNTASDGPAPHEYGFVEKSIGWKYKQYGGDNETNIRGN